jgi:polyphosphate kinase
MLINPPYQSYDSVLRFFNEAATEPAVEEIYVTFIVLPAIRKLLMH